MLLTTVDAAATKADGTRRTATPGQALRKPLRMARKRRTSAAAADLVWGISSIGTKHTNGYG